MIYALPIIMAVFYRLRGGPWSFKYWLTCGVGGTFYARLFWWSLPNAVAGCLLFGWAGAWLGLAAYLGLLWIFSHGDEQDDAATSWRAVAVLSGKGAGRGLMADATIYAATGFIAPWMTLSMLGLGLVYWLAWKLPHFVLVLPAPFKEWRKDEFFHGATSYAEFMTGLLWGAGLLGWALWL